VLDPSTRSNQIVELNVKYFECKRLDALKDLKSLFNLDTDDDI